MKKKLLLWASKNHQDKAGDADITLYTVAMDARKMFGIPRVDFVINFARKKKSASRVQIFLEVDVTYMTPTCLMTQTLRLLAAPNLGRQALLVA